MHLAEGTLPLRFAAIGWVVALPFLGWSLASTRRRDGADEALGGTPALLPAATSLLFAATLLPLPVPVVGATSHICLTPVLALLLGVRPLIWPTFFVLLLQALFFAHGGLTTLGVNAVSLGVVGPVVAVVLAWGLRGLGAPWPLSVGLACGLADLAVYVVDAGVLALALADVTPPITVFWAILLGFAPVQLPLALVEGAVSVALVRALVRRRPGLLPPWLSQPSPRVSASGVGAALLVLLTLTSSGCVYEGIDATVFGAVAERSGRPPTESLIDLSGGELGLAVSVSLPFVFGFLAGRAWERLGRQEDEQPR
jgi:cobalt/nickel transport system permease protein